MIDPQICILLVFLKFGIYVYLRLFEILDIAKHRVSRTPVATALLDENRMYFI